MNTETIYKREYDTCNRFVLKTFAVFTAFMCIVLILNAFKIFLVAPIIIRLFTALIALTFLALIVIYNLQKKRNRNSLSFAYISATITLLVVGFIYSIFGFHATLLFLLPAILFNLYGKKWLTYYVIFGTVVTMIISHVVCYYLGINPDQPFKELNKVILFDLLPKLIIFLFLTSIILFQSNNNYKMIQNICKYNREMYLSQEELIKAFAEICESKSGQTGEHVKRVSLYVSVMAEQLNIEEQEKECFVIASMMHDVGKLNIPSEILDKKGKLTEEEYEIIKKHTEYGYELLKKSPGRAMEIGKDVAKNHHERWDGKGYNHLLADEITLYSRIMAICDVFDALVSKRSYKEQWKPEDAYEEIVAQQGKQFDPELVKIFQQCYPKFVEILQEYPS